MIKYESKLIKKRVKMIKNGQFEIFVMELNLDVFLKGDQILDHL